MFSLNKTRERERGGEEEENRFRILIKRLLRSMRTIYDIRVRSPS